MMCKFSDGPTQRAACTRLGVRAAFLSMFLACVESRFGDKSTLPPQAGNASRWAAVMEEKELLT